jgi:hypothetical protein
MMALRNRSHAVAANDNWRDPGPSAPLVRHALPEPARAAIAERIEWLISLLDAADADPDVELNGDELDGSGVAEDEFVEHWNCNLLPAGCPISDPGGDPLDAGELEEWRTEGCSPVKPRYGDDQSAGPINEGEAHRVWFKHTRRASL